MSSVRPEDLLVMKAIAHRSRDLIDIEGLLIAHPAADIESVRKWLKEFSIAATMPDLLLDFDKLVSKTKKLSKSKPEAELVI